MLIHHR